MRKKSVRKMEKDYFCSDWCDLPDMEIVFSYEGVKGAIDALVAGKTKENHNPQIGVWVNSEFIYLCLFIFN